MKKNIEKIILWGEIIFVFFLKAGHALALELHYPNIGKLSINDLSTLPDYAKYFFNIGLLLAGSLAVLSIAFGGVYYLVSYGRGKFTDEGKDWMKAGITGLLIILSAYLIANTINPDLIAFKFTGLQQINLNLSSVPTTPSGISITTYQEIPIGTLTENLLTITMDCYGFDQAGDPIYNQITTDDNQKIDGPTYTDHDRIDCLLQLFDGSQKKAQAVNELSKAIKNLMSQCKCEGTDAKGNPLCKPQNSVCDPASGDGTCSCGGPCSKCQPTASCTAGQKNSTGDCCPTGVKNQIEHGPINVSIGIGGGSGKSCTIPTVAYKGLDEFRSQYNNDYSSIKNAIEKEVQINGEQIEIIDKNSWSRARLIDQLTYFKGKIDEIKTSLQDDEDTLNNARGALSSCYLAIPYVDLLKTYTSTDQQQHLILTQKFSDKDGNKIDASTYCQGFNYDSSSCLKKCNDMCPDTGDQAINSYRACADPTTQEECMQDAYNNRLCVNGPDASQKFNDSGDPNSCISSCQNDCLNECAKKDPSKCSDEYKICQSQCNNDSQCVLNNEGDCLLDSSSTKDIIDCTNQITDKGNTNYCISNAYLCKYGSNEYAGYPDCVDSTIGGCSSDVYSSSFLYDSLANHSPGCDKCPYPYSPPDKGTVCYKSGTFCKNDSTCKNGEKCISGKCGTPCKDSSTCIDNGECIDGMCSNTSCQELCPETTKCLTDSRCPNCPCNQTDAQTLNFSAPNKISPIMLPKGMIPASTDQPSTDQSCSSYTDSDNCEAAGCAYEVGDKCDSGDSDNTGTTSMCGWHITKQIPTNPLNYTLSESEPAAYMITGPQCVNYAINDDPLTFYCENDWWSDPGREGLSATPIGQERVCPLADEVPVGQTVDDANAWFTTIMDPINNEEKDIQNTVDFIKQIGSAINPGSTLAPNYCKCNGEYGDSATIGPDPICTTDCVPTPDGTCVLLPCAGNSCMQMMDYLSKISDYYRLLKLDFVNFYTTMFTEPRSDIMKELTYSRQETNGCSLTSSAYGIQTRMLSCTRVEDEIISPINGGVIKFSGQDVNNYCYGNSLGNIFGKDLTDNWFCCQEYSKSPTLNSNQ